MDNVPICNSIAARESHISFSIKSSLSPSVAVGGIISCSELGIGSVCGVVSTSPAGGGTVYLAFVLSIVKKK